MRIETWIIFILLCVGCGGKEQMEQKMTSNVETPIVDRSENIKQFDGQTIWIKGIFRKSLTKRKMRDPGTFMGAAHIEFAAPDVDEEFIIELGKRSTQDFEQFTNKHVKVLGELLFDPYKESRESDDISARIVMGPPKLLSIQKIQLAAE